MNIKNTLKRNSCPTHLVDKVIKKHIDKNISKGDSQIVKEKETSNVRSIKLPMENRNIGKFSKQLNKKLHN